MIGVYNRFEVEGISSDMPPFRYCSNVIEEDFNLLCVKLFLASSDRSRSCCSARPASTDIARLTGRAVCHTEYLLPAFQR